MIVGAIDIGSNSMRLLIVDGNLDVRVNQRSITQLGAGVDATGRFNAAAMAKTLAVMDEFGELLRAHDVDVLAAVATSATRDASNGAEFVAEVARRIGMAPEVISGTRGSSVICRRHSGTHRWSVSRGRHRRGINGVHSRGWEHRVRCEH